MKQPEIVRYVPRAESALVSGVRRAAVALLVIAGAVSSAAQTTDSRAAVRLPAAVEIDGKAMSLPRGPDAELVVLAWTAQECPMAKVYAPRLRALASDWRGRGVLFLFVDSTPAAATDSRPREADELRPLILDPSGDLARRMGAQSTTEVILFDRLGDVAYRGALDDQYGYRRGDGPGPRTYRKDAPTANYLRDAIDAVRDGKKPAVTVTDPMGCLLTTRVVPATPSVAASLHEPVFYQGANGVEAVVRRSCVDCHRSGGNAPFSLEHLDDVRRRADMVLQVVEERRMPPWSADPKHGTFSNDPTLSPADLSQLTAWLRGSRASGDPTTALPALPPLSEWEIGTPDAIFSAPSFSVPAEGTLPYRYVRVPTDFKEDRWVEAMQVQSSAPEVVHHVLIFLENGKPPLRGVKRPWTPRFDPLSLLEGATPTEYPEWIRRFQPYLRDLSVGGGGGVNGSFATSLAAGRGMTYPLGRAKLLPRGADITFQIHYTPDGRMRDSTTRLGLRFAATPPKEPVDSRSLATVAFEIPPGANAHEVVATKVMPRDALLLSLRPHMHLRGKSFRYVAEFPDGRKETLLDVPKWDFEWQTEYILAKPITLPKGTRLAAIATYDNSAANPANPDPAKTVYFGLQSEEEMMIGYYEVIWSEKKTSAAKTKALKDDDR